MSGQERKAEIMDVLDVIIAKYHCNLRQQAASQDESESPGS
jgi:hypothetical protein